MRDTTIPSGSSSLHHFGLMESDAERLVQELGQPSVQNRRLVRGALRELGEAAIPALLRGLKSSDLAVRQGAVELLRQIDCAHHAIDELADALRDEDWLVRMWAADALGRLRSAALPAAAALENAVRDPVVQVRTAAFVALRWIRGMGNAG